MTNVTMDLVDAIGEAFNANNIDAVMKFFFLRCGLRPCCRAGGAWCEV